MRITKEFKAEISHKLAASYTAKCRNIHGHSYKFYFTLESGVADRDGVVVDFTKVKEIVKPEIDRWDHSLIMAEFDPAIEEVKKLAKQYKLRLLIANFNPTAEQMASYLMRLFYHKLSSNGVELVEVRVDETATSQAVCSAVSSAGYSLTLYEEGAE